MVQNKKYIWLNSSCLNSVIHDDDDQVKIKLSTKSCHFNYCWLHKVSEQSLHFLQKKQNCKAKIMKWSVMFGWVSIKRSVG